MVGDGLLGDGDVFHPGSGAGGLGEVDGKAFPEDIMLAVLDLFNPGLQGFIVPDRDSRLKFLVIIDLVQVMLLTVFRIPARPNQLFQDLVLILQSGLHGFANPVIYIGSERFRQYGFQLHDKPKGGEDTDCGGAGRMSRILLAGNNNFFTFAVRNFRV